MTTKLPFPTGPAQSLKNLIGLPLRTVFANQPFIQTLGLTSLQEERINAIWPYLNGKVLDVGAGNNRLLTLYKNGVGVDVHDWGAGAQVVQDTSKLPFKDGEFDTVCFIACLNHIPNRAEALKESYRVLKPSGQILLTMLNPIIGYTSHAWCWHEESDERHTHEGEVMGLWPSVVEQLLKNSGYGQIWRKRFFYGLNTLYRATKPS